MWTIFIAIIVYAGVGLMFFLLGQISLQKKIEKKTGVKYQNYTQSNLITLINTWKRAWDDQQDQERTEFIHGGGGNDGATAKEG